MQMIIDFPLNRYFVLFLALKEKKIFFGMAGDLVGHQAYTIYKEALDSITNITNRYREEQSWISSVTVHINDAEPGCSCSVALTYSCSKVPKIFA